jgi:hypothetical protein
MLPLSPAPSTIRRAPLAGLLPLLLLAGCSDATARTLPVSDDAGLKKAIAAARAGDRITLAPGSYGPIDMNGRKIEGAPVTLSGQGARIAAIALLDARGWAIDGLTVGGAFQGGFRVIHIQDSSDISIRNNLIHGLNVNNDPWDDRGNGIGVRNGRRIEVVGNRFRDIYLGFVAGNSADIRFEGNSLAFVREGSNWVSVKNATIRCNRFSHFYPDWIKKEHPDAIQGWWNKGQGGNENFLIEGNAILTGGPRAVQGIFLAGSYMPKGDPANRMRNFTIRDNIYWGSSAHGITLSGAENFVIERNTILPSPHAQQETTPERSADGRRSRGFSPIIKVIGDVSTGRISGNIANFIAAPPTVEIGENRKFKRISERGRAWTKIFATPPAGDDPAFDSFAARDDVGARPICGNRLPPPIDLPSGLDPTSDAWPGG